MKRKVYKINWKKSLENEQEELKKHYDNNIKCDENCYHCKLDKLDEE
jgi:hypothetical protein